ncbi:MAG: TonB-dependent receptor [Gammaproteobacteria bacterium]
MKKNDLDTYHKALALNMDKAPYGTIAEIGAGQETSRWFFKVGGAAASIAKTMSAYDMKFSDSIYGPCKRYVSRERLQAMLDKEYNLVIERLDELRGAESTFYAFANTVSTYSYTQQRTGNGWLGIRLQTHPREAASQIDLHVVLKGKSNTQDQKTLGILGVNLIYGAHYFYHDPIRLLTSLMDGLSDELLAINMIDFEGPAYASVDNRLMALYLVKYGLTHAAMFNADGKLVQPSDALYKKSVLVERSRFRPPTLLNLNVLDSAYDAFIKEPDVDPDEIVVLSEMTLLNLRDRDGDELEEDVCIEDFLHRVDILCALNKNVLISNFGKFYKLSQYLYRRTSKPVAIALGIPNLLNIFNEKYYADLNGGILESFGLLFRNDMRLYVSPFIDEDSAELVDVHNVKIKKHLRHLYLHLIENEYIKGLETINKEYLSIKSDEVMDKIRSGDASWSESVPDEVFSIISKRGLFQKKVAAKKN